MSYSKIIHLVLTFVYIAIHILNDTESSHHHINLLNFTFWLEEASKNHVAHEGIWDHGF